METRLTVIDKIAAADPTRLIASQGTAPDLETLLSWISDLPPRSPSTAPNSIGALSNGILRACAAKMAARTAGETLRPAAVAAPGLRLSPPAPSSLPTSAASMPARIADEIVELSYELREAAWTNQTDVADGIYEP